MMYLLYVKSCDFIHSELYLYYGVVDLLCPRSFSESGIGGFSESVANRFLDPELLFISDNASFTLVGNINRYWCFENP